jgi:anti-sigma factor RsiW
MACEAWSEKLDACVDGELPQDETRALNEHLRGCAACAAEVLRLTQLKLAVRNAGQRFTPDPAFRARIQAAIQKPSRGPTLSRWNWRWLPVLATVAALAIVAAVVLSLRRDSRSDAQMISELVDQHVATLASANPVDVVSTDRHTVKPWFAGKIPFSFNLPELQDSPFTLAGGKISYLGQSPGAELIFNVRQHRISVFIFQDRGAADLLQNSRLTKALRSTLAFEVRSWRQNGLRYFVIGDASPQDMDKLSELVKSAG